MGPSMKLCVSCRKLHAIIFVGGRSFAKQEISDYPSCFCNALRDIRANPRTPNRDIDRSYAYETMVFYATLRKIIQTHGVLLEKEVK
jgi:hypothetical protein